MPIARAALVLDGLGLGRLRARPHARFALRRTARSAGPDRAARTASVGAVAGRADQPPRRRRRRLPGGADPAACPATVVIASHDRAFLYAVLHRPDRPRPGGGRPGPLRRQLQRLPVGEARRAGALGAAVRRGAGGTGGGTPVGGGDRTPRCAGPGPYRQREDGVRPPGWAGAEPDLTAGPQRHPAAGGTGAHPGHRATAPPAVRGRGTGRAHRGGAAAPGVPARCAVYPAGSH
ncbi:hypothetical protein SANTM175S_09205 [Streptomyces antimycoticus]